jgi:predicted GIY-YIG superfamily endonuclease/ribosomal protein S14
MANVIYTLKLEGGKYYVGKTTNMKRRFEEHRAGKGSFWTKKYRPLQIIKTVSETSPFDEDKATKEAMSQYGIENVRGGSYTCMTLDEEQLCLLTTEIRGAKNQCVRCGRTGHFSKECWATTDEKGEEISSDSDSESESDSDSESNRCFRCGREGHYASSCYASYHKNGYRLSY